MEKLKALITLFVLGTSSVAMAQPHFDESHDDRYDDRRDDRYDDRYEERRDQREPRNRDRGRRWDRSDADRSDGVRHYRSSWVSLAEPMQLARGRDMIDVRLRGTFTQLRIQTVAGASYLDRVIVFFRDGSRQVAEVNRAVTPHNRMVELLLDGNNRHIDRIAVVGRSQRNAAIQVFGI